jgi:hypothetical protein
MKISWNKGGEAFRRQILGMRIYDTSFAGCSRRDSVEVAGLESVGDSHRRFIVNHLEK